MSRECYLPIVEGLAELLLSVDRKYLLETFNLSENTSVKVRHAGFIAICEYGDISSGSIGGIVVEWWQLDEGHFERVKSPHLLLAESAGEFDETPVLKLFVENETFVLGERYGENLACRRIGKVADLTHAKGFSSFPLVWATSPE